MKVERVSLDDCRSWGRALKSYEGAYGTGIHEPISSDDLSFDGSVWGHIPIERWQVIAIWNAGSMGKEDPKSGWHRIPEYDSFRLDVKSYKVRAGFLTRHWFTRFGFLFGEVSAGNLIEIADFGSCTTRSIANTFLCTDGLLRGEWALARS